MIGYNLVDLISNAFVYKKIMFSYKKWREFFFIPHVIVSLNLLTMIIINCQDRFQKLSLLTSWIFDNRIIYFWNKLLNKIKNNHYLKKLRLNWMVLEK